MLAFGRGQVWGAGDVTASIDSEGFLLFALAAGALSAEPSRPAGAQGGLVCDFGPTRYRQCCRESYRRNPDLGAQRRSDDIDACMNGPARARDSDRPRSDRERDRDRDRDSNRRRSDRDRSDDRVSPRSRAAGASGIRKMDCTAGGCSSECGADEMVVSAFCKAGALPTLFGDRAARCSRGDETELPTAVFCATRN